MSKENSYVQRDYRHIALEVLSDMAEEFPDMSFGEMLYTIVKNSANNLGLKNTHILTQICDEDWYKICEKQYKFEKE